MGLSQKSLASYATSQNGSSRSAADSNHYTQSGKVMWQKNRLLRIDCCGLHEVVLVGGALFRR